MARCHLSQTSFQEFSATEQGEIHLFFRNYVCDTPILIATQSHGVTGRGVWRNVSVGETEEESEAATTWQDLKMVRDLRSASPPPLWEEGQP